MDGSELNNESDHDDQSLSDKDCADQYVVPTDVLTKDCGVPTKGCDVPTKDCDVPTKDCDVPVGTTDSMSLCSPIGLSQNSLSDKSFTNMHFDPTLYSKPEAQLPLYEGSSITLLEAISQYLEWFTSHPGVSKEALSHSLKMQHKILPPGNLLPDDYESMMTLVSPFLIEPIIFHACANDCILYRNQYAESVVCPACNMARYRYASIPNKKFIYLPIRPRLERLFGTECLSHLIQAHNNSLLGQEMYDIHDSSMWKDAFSKGCFSGDTRGIGLSLCTDGVNPFSHQRVTYSMWPIMMTILNMPRGLRNRFGNILLLGIIPGSGTKEPSTLNPYLEVVVDELLHLSGSSIFDAYKGAPFQVKVDLMLYILDYPGVCKVFNVSGSGAYKGCMWCHIKGKVIQELLSDKINKYNNYRYIQL